MQACEKTEEEPGKEGGQRRKPQAQASEHKEGPDTHGREIIPHSHMTGSDRLRNCHPGHGKVIDKFFRFPGK